MRPETSSDKKPDQKNAADLKEFMLFRAGAQRFALPLSMVKSVFRESVIGECIPVSDEENPPSPSDADTSGECPGPGQNIGFPLLRCVMEGRPVHIHDVAGYFHSISRPGQSSPQLPETSSAENRASDPSGSDKSESGPGSAGKRIILLNDELYGESSGQIPDDNSAEEDPSAPGSALRVDDTEKVAAIAPDAVLPLPPIFQGLCARLFPGVALPGDGPPALILHPSTMTGFDARQLFADAGPDDTLETEMESDAESGMPVPLTGDNQAELDAALARLISPDMLKRVMERQIRNHIRSGLGRHAQTAARALSQLWAE